MRCLAAHDSSAKVQLFSHRSHVQMRRIAVRVTHVQNSRLVSIPVTLYSVIPIVLSYEAITTASWEGCNVNVCTSSTPSNDSFVKSTGTSVGGLTWLGRKPTRDDPRCNRVLDPPVYQGTTRKDYRLGVHCISQHGITCGAIGCWNSKFYKNNKEGLRVRGTL